MIDIADVTSATFALAAMATGRAADISAIVTGLVVIRASTRAAARTIAGVAVGVAHFGGKDRDILTVYKEKGRDSALFFKKK